MSKCVFLCIGLEAVLMGKDDPIAGNCWNCSKISGNCRRKYKINEKVMLLLLKNI